MPNTSNYLSKARINKADEFHTQYQDIVNEVSHYKTVFMGKVVYCNCDSENSNFWKFFVNNFQEYSLKALYATCHNLNGQGTMLKYDGNNIIRQTLQGTGDFNSPECLNIMDSCDIVCTNPPFSLFTKFISTLVSHNVQFLVIGNQNALSSSLVFDLVKNNKLWAGYGFKGDAGFFINKNNYEDYATSSSHKDGMIRVSGVMWFTNIPTDKQSEKIELTKHYTGNEDYYPKYDDYDAINVDSLKDIPDDYYGPIGVPITFLKKFNPSQFEVLGLDKDFTDNGRKGRFKMDGKTKYARVIIRRKQTDNPITNTYRDLTNRMNNI